MTLQSIVLRYTFFAVLATLANLATQRGVLWFGNNYMRFALAVGTGTLVGLVLKYILDKRWIFGDTSVGVKSHSKKLSLYTAMGIITTALFWGTETIFWLAWQTDAMRELGAVIGLSFGYVIKYRLDRVFVFTEIQREHAK